MGWAMTPSGQTTGLRLVPSLTQPWHPHPYQQRAVEHLVTHRSAGLALDPGLGKTASALAAFQQLRQNGAVKTMLVIAPLRVCRTVWRQEAQKWEQFRDLRINLLHGPKKAKALQDDADVWLLNPEGVAWLCSRLPGRQLPFDILCIDELTRFKNSRAQRSKVLRKHSDRVAWRWGLTGSLLPNGMMDLFGQQLVLDGGAALGRYITHYRDQYFQADYNGFDYRLLPGADKRIVERIAPYWVQMSAEDYLTLPPLIEDMRYIVLEPEARKAYQDMKGRMLAELPEGSVTAANAAAVYSKLAQMANGAVYMNDDTRTVLPIHDSKLEALEELIEELGGKPLLVAYEFQHDLRRLLERFGKNTPYLGRGTTPKQEAAWIAAWNRGEISVMFAHPASAGHGLNLQGSGAAHVCWFSRTWDYELYEQFIRRVRRQGNTAETVFNHILCVEGTIDVLKGEALRDKDTTQVSLLRALRDEISSKETKGDDKMAKLSRVDQETAERTVGPAVPISGGWGTPRGAQEASSTHSTVAQKERIAAAISPSEQVRAAFSGAIQAQMDAVEEAPRTPSPAANPKLGISSMVEAPKPRLEQKANPSLVTTVRLECLKIAFADQQTSVDDGLEIARTLEKWVGRDD